MKLLWLSEQDFIVVKLMNDNMNLPWLTHHEILLVPFKYFIDFIEPPTYLANKFVYSES